MKNFYFSRIGRQNPFALKWLVSGAVRAETMDDAKAKLDAALRKAGESSENFSFCDLDETEAEANGLVCITMGEA